MKRVFGILIIVVVAIGVSLFMVVSSPEKNLTKGAIKPQLVLNQIKVEKQQERDGDELYLTLGARVDGESIQYIRIPAKPDHWLSRQIELVKNVSLWSEPLAEGQAVTVNIELNEADAEPLNPDDLLGIMRVRLKNEKGSLTVYWDIPNRTGIDAPKKRAGQPADTFSQEPGKVGKFDLYNDGAHYEVYLSVNK